jgi:hypothetical protein
MIELSVFFDSRRRASSVDAANFTARVTNDIMRVTRFALFVRRIHRAIKWDKEGMGTTTSRGHCLTMEDVTVVIPDLTDEDSFFAVYDGSGGNGAAEFAAKHLHREMKDSGDFEDNIQVGRCALAARSDVSGVWFVRATRHPSQPEAGVHPVSDVCVGMSRPHAAWCWARPYPYPYPYPYPGGHGLCLPDRGQEHPDRRLLLHLRCHLRVHPGARPPRRMARPVTGRAVQGASHTLPTHTFPHLPIH